MKPIATEYKEFKFRSGLEVRWAVFFDEAGIVKDYESEGYEMEDGSRYLPDFWLPHVAAQTYTIWSPKRRLPDWVVNREEAQRRAEESWNDPKYDPWSIDDAPIPEK